MLNPLLLIKKMTLWSICTLPLLAYFASAQAGGLPTSADQLHAVSHESPVLFNWIFGVSVLGLGFFLHRTLKSIDSTSERQWKAIGEALERLHTLEGEHHQRGMFCPAVKAMQDGSYLHCRPGDPDLHRHNRATNGHKKTERRRRPAKGDKP